MIAQASKTRVYKFQRRPIAVGQANVNVAYGIDRLPGIGFLSGQCNPFATVIQAAGKRTYAVCDGRVGCREFRKVLAQYYVVADTNERVCGEIVADSIVEPVVAEVDGARPGVVDLDELVVIGFAKGLIGVIHEFIDHYLGRGQAREKDQTEQGYHQSYSQN